LVKEGAQRASKTAATKAEITALASEFLQGKTASLKIHKEDCEIAFHLPNRLHST
jgi:hypothetical protein